MVPTRVRSLTGEPDHNVTKKKRYGPNTSLSMLATFAQKARIPVFRELKLTIRDRDSNPEDRLSTQPYQSNDFTIYGKQHRGIPQSAE